jgi:DNA-binding NarL/FixJ family response regulator
MNIKPNQISILSSGITSSELSDYGARPGDLALSAFASEDRSGSAAVLDGTVEIAVIDDRVLLRECFARSLVMIQDDLAIRHFSALEDFAVAAAEPDTRIGLALMCVEWRKSRSAEYLRQIAHTAAAFPKIEIILMSDIDDFNEIMSVMESGARGYIPTSVRLEVALRAMHLVKAGGAYIPASVLLWSNQIIKEMSQAPKHRTDTDFTPRQLAVAEALRRGKANKLIAYELNMCESTVKVHIRSIMKKLKAKNRTEVSFIMNKLMNGEDIIKKPANHTPITW